jgi:hypothetical protein
VEGHPHEEAYRKVAVKEVDVAALAAELGVGRAFAIDVAKVDMVAAIVAGDGRVVRTICWKNPSENGLVLALVAGLRRADLSVEAVMESSGTYGDVLRHQLLEHGVPVYRMSGKRTHDAVEVYDGVPSLHDAKSAAIIAKLHLDRFSTPWGQLSEEKRELKAAIATMDLYRKQHQRPGCERAIPRSAARHRQGDLPLKQFCLRSKTPRLSRGTLRKLSGRKCPMKRIRHRRANARRKCFGLPRPTPPRFRARVSVSHAPTTPTSLLLTALQVLQRLVGRRSRCWAWPLSRRGRCTS